MGWKAVINIISDKYRPSETVDAVLALLTECGDSDTDFFDKKVDSETEDELKSVGEKYSIDCQVQSKTIRQYYDFIIARMNQTTRECEALENSTSIYSEEFTIPALATFVVLVGVFVFVQCVPAIGKSNTDSDKIQTESQNSYDSSESETVSEDSASKYPSTSDSSESKSQCGEHQPAAMMLITKTCLNIRCWNQKLILIVIFTRWVMQFLVDLLITMCRMANSLRSETIPRKQTIFLCMETILCMDIIIAEFGTCLMTIIYWMR